MTNWTTADMPSLKGRSAIVTGTGGIGFEVSLALAKAGAQVVIAGRNLDKGLEAVKKIRQQVPNADVSFEVLDLASLQSVSEFGTRFRAHHTSLDILVNNAAIMNPPARLESVDGYELQLATNYLGHFALTAQLLPLLAKANSARVVTLSSIASRHGKISFGDLQSERGYVPMNAYGQSKLACLMFAFELQRRSDANGWSIASIAAHPGVSRTKLLLNSPEKKDKRSFAREAFWFLFQPASQGALPIIYAATSSKARPGHYYGPNGFFELRGYPSESKIPPQALEIDVAKRLWTESERLTGASFDLQRTTV